TPEPGPDSPGRDAPPERQSRQGRVGRHALLGPGPADRIRMGGGLGRAAARPDRARAWRARRGTGTPAGGAADFRAHPGPLRGGAHARGSRRAGTSSHHAIRPKGRRLLALVAAPVLGATMHVMVTIGE